MATTAEPAMWAHLWRAAAHFELGDLAAAAADVTRLERPVERIRAPLARWQLARSHATLAQAQGRFDDAERFAKTALDVVRGVDHPAAQRLYYGVMTVLARHVGAPAGLADEIAAFEGSFGPFRDFRNLSLAIVLLAEGRRAEAVAEHRRLGPLAAWDPPWYLRRIALAMRLLVAVGLEDRDETAALRDRLGDERGRHVTGISGTAVYLGPVELYLGMADRLLGHLDSAVADLDTARAVAGRNGARPFGVEAQYELGRALVERAAPGDLERARYLLAGCQNAAHELGMAPFARRAGRLLAGVGGRPGFGLSAREREVAKLVARGLSNRRIAEALVVSERTAQNHVQHILTKLGFSTRSQIAAWVAGRDEYADE